MKLLANHSSQNLQINDVTGANNTGGNLNVNNHHNETYKNGKSEIPKPKVSAGNIFKNFFK